MRKITLSELFAELDRCERAVPLDVLCDRLRRLDVSAAELREHVRFSEATYRRNLVHLGPGYAALVLCWRPGQSSPVHDHRGSACALRVLAGVASELRYRREADGRLIAVASNSYPVGAVCGTYDADIHAMLNDDPAGQDLVTLHVYTPPMREYYSYSLDSATIRVCGDQEVLEEERRRAAVSA